MASPNTVREPIRDTDATRKALMARLPTTRVDTDNQDQFTLLPHQTVAGVTREWKTHTVLGEVQLADEAKYRQQGWVPVLTEEAVDLMPPGTPESDPIMRGGMILWQRLASLTEQSRAQEQHKAIMQKRQKVAQLSERPDGHIGRHVNNLSKSLEQVPVPTADEPL